MSRYDYRIDFAYTGEDGTRTARHGFVAREPDPITWADLRRLPSVLRSVFHRDDITVWSVTLVRKQEWR